MVDDAMQKNSVAIVASMIAEVLVRFPEKTSGENTKRFLIHCLGLNKINKSRQFRMENVTLFLYMILGRKFSVRYINYIETGTIAKSNSVIIAAFGFHAGFRGRGASYDF